MMRYGISVVLIFIAFLWLVYGQYIYNNQWFREYSQTKNILVNQSTDKTVLPKEMNVNLLDMDVADPKQCETDFCYKEVEVSVTVKKTWKPMTAVVNDESLKSSDFAKQFLNISQKKIVNNNSPVYDRIVLQKVLYDRGLLGSKPTWKLWYLTEQAIMKLQCMKWFQEYDTWNSMFIIWPKTIAEINKIKDKMKNPNYLKKTPLPNIDLSKCWSIFQQRNIELGNLLWNPPSRANNSYQNSSDVSAILKLEGQVTVKSQ